LVKIADPRFASLIKVLQDEVFDIRWLVAEALIAIGSDSIKPLLSSLANEPKELFLREGAHHVIKYIISQNPKEREMNEILKSVESALDGAVPSITPLAKDELSGPRGAGYKRMIEISPAGRAGTPDEVATVGALLMGPDGAFITGSDFLINGGVTAAYWCGELAPK
jgi:hypothetical protein